MAKYYSFRCCSRSVSLSSIITMQHVNLFCGVPLKSVLPLNYDGIGTIQSPLESETSMSSEFSVFRTFYFTWNYFIMWHNCFFYFQNSQTMNMVELDISFFVGKGLFHISSSLLLLTLFLILNIYYMYFPCENWTFSYFYLTYFYFIYIHTKFIYAFVYYVWNFRLIFNFICTKLMLMARII